MRRLIVLIALTALALAPNADAAQYGPYVSSSADRLSLRGGHGVARLLSSDGVFWGNLGLGRISIRDLGWDGGVTSVHVWGWERVRYPRPGTIVYINLRKRMWFEIVDGRWRATVRGRSIYASAALTGRATLSDGRAGTYQVNYGDRNPWPWAPQTVLP